MDIFERLTIDHARQRDLSGRIMETSGDTRERRELFRLFKDELDAHALAEEQTFYAEIMVVPEGTEIARHSVAEHKELDDLVQELCDLEMSSGGWIHKFSRLRDRVLHHVNEEEADVFPLAKSLIETGKAKELAGHFETRKDAEAS